MPLAWTRRQVLAAGLKVGGGLLALASAGYAGYRWPHGLPETPGAGVDHFVSRPDLSPPTITVSVEPQFWELRTPRQVALAPRAYVSGAPGQQGVMILGLDGHPQWFRSTEGTPMDMRVQTYLGRPVLTWWEGQVIDGYGRGIWRIVDQSYQEVRPYTPAAASMPICTSSCSPRRARPSSSPTPG